MKRRYNFIYAKLVENEFDLTGLIGYGLYKRDKITFIKKFEKDHGREPVEDDLAHFHETSDLHVKDYEFRAIELTRIFMEETFASKQEYLDKEYADKAKRLEENYREKLDCKKRELSARWWPGVLQGLVGSALFALVIGAIIVVILGFKLGFWKTLELIGHTVSAPLPAEIIKHIGQ